MKISEAVGSNDKILVPGDRHPIDHKQTNNQERFFGKIMRECSEALTAMKQTDKFMYRGMADVPHGVFTGIFAGHTRIDRQPVDSSKHASAMIDQLMIHSGMTALRSNSIFVTSRYHFAKDYGEVYIILPKNGFSFTWTDHEDLITFVDTAFQPQINRKATYDKYNDPEARKKFALWWPRSQLRAFLSPYTSGPYSHLDVLLNRYAQDMSMSPTDWNDMITLIDRKLQQDGVLPEMYKPVMYKPSAESIKEKLGAKNYDLPAALISGHEIMIYGEYYAFLGREWENHLKLLLGSVK